MEFHPIANIFPLIHGDEFDNFKADILANGQREPIYLYQGMILDGRNRYRACVELGIEPKFQEYSGDKPLEFTISLNLKRRHLNETQRAVIASKIANMTRGGDRPSQNDSTFETANLHNGISQPTAAALLNVSPRTVATVKAVEKAAPEMVERMASGEITANEANKTIKKIVREEIIQKQKDVIAENKYIPITNLFDVIVIDPPWPYGTEYDPDGRRSANPYPEMSLDEISRMDLSASDNCVLWLWTTHKFMRYSFDLIDKWGFRDVSILTWVKSRMGLGSWLRSQSEFCIMAVKGKPIINLTNQTTVIYGPMREHSRKPDEFYNMVDGLCVGYKIDWFSREKREGWTQFGNDTEKFQ